MGATLAKGTCLRAQEREDFRTGPHRKLRFRVFGLFSRPLRFLCRTPAPRLLGDMEGESEPGHEPHDSNSRDAKVAIEGDFEGPVLPTCRLAPSDGLLTGETPVRAGDPPYWNLLHDPGGRTAIAAAQRALHVPPPSSEKDFVIKLLQQFSCWTLDLPASENHHHARPNGLYLHSLEVASDSVRDLHGRWCLRLEGSVLTAAQKALWLNVAFALGLFHDCGKILDIEVRLSKSGPCWDPLSESLTAFKTRHGVDVLAPTPHEFRPGRGQTGHERKGISLLPVILADRSWDWLHPLLTDALAAYACRREESLERVEVPLAYLVGRIQLADTQSLLQDLKRTRRG
jgi:hypothetical protein